MSEADVSPAPGILTEILRTRSFKIGAVLHTLLAITLIFVPLFNVLGFERALATALLATVTTPPITVAAVEHARAHNKDSFIWWAASTLMASAILIPSWIAGALFESFTMACDVEVGAQFFVLLGLGNVLVGSALAYAVSGFLGPGGRWKIRSTVIATYGVELIWLFVGLAQLYAEPQIFIYLSPFGFWPGSLYDEALSVPLALWAFRGFGVFLTLSITLLVRAFLAPSGQISFRKPSAIFATLGILSVSLAVWSHRRGGELGFTFNRKVLQRVLSQEIVTQHFILHIDPSIPQSSAEELAREHEFQFQQLSNFFDVTPKEKIRSFVYRNATQKGQLLGASRTQIARPWVREIHIHGSQVPHPVLKHELAHIFSGEFAPPPFHIPMHGGLPNIGLIEGIAVAADWPVRELTIHEWASAMMKLGRLPNVSESLDPTGFWSLASSRAYTSAGSFVRWLIDKDGLKSFARIYRGESFATVYGESSATLETKWRLFLTQMDLDDVALRMAEHRFAQPSIFQKVCARTSATLSREALSLLRAGNLKSARQAIEQSYAFHPSNPALVSALARAYLRNGELEAAKIFAQKAEASPGSTEKARARARELLGLIAWHEGDLKEARTIFEAIRELRLSTPSVRLQTVYLETLDRDPHRQASLRAYLSGEFLGGHDLVVLASLTHAFPDDAIIAYLFARRLEQVNATTEALDLVPRFEALPSEELKAEARRLHGRLRYRSGHYRQAAKVFAQAKDHGPRPADQAIAADWEARARFAIRPE